ncbi:MAG TPA: hypothetical protein VKU40_01940, partial [Thermoanaerobaculia bacterium]|nr:hypothetical protein [Thermoanaerobaculia bacterium]
MPRPLGCLAATVVLLLAVPSAAGQAEPLPLDDAAIRGGALVALDDGWSFSAGNSERPPADLAAAVPVGTQLRRDGVPDGWDGDGWFVRDLAVPEGLVGVPTAFVFFHRGVVTVWVDGEELGHRGNAVGDTAAGDDWARPPASLPLPLTFERAGVHRLAVHFRNPALADHHRAGALAGFTARFGKAEAVAASRLAEVKRNSMMLWLFTGIFVSFGVLHLCLWG